MENYAIPLLSSFPWLAPLSLSLSFLPVFPSFSLTLSSRRQLSEEVMQSIWGGR